MMMMKKAKNIKFDEFGSREKKKFWFSKFGGGKVVFEYWSSGVRIVVNFDDDVIKILECSSERDLSIRDNFSARVSI